MNPRRLLPFAAFAIAATAIMIPGCDELITETNYIEIAGHPVAEFDVDRDSGCVPETVQFLDLSVGPHDEWLWDFGDGDTSTEFEWIELGGGDSVAQSNPLHVYDSSGTFDVTLTIRNSEDEGEDTEFKRRFIVMGTSVADFSVDTAIGCPGLEVSFTPEIYGGVDTWLWEFGDGGTADTAYAVHTYTSAGIYSVILITTGPCGIDSVAYDSLIHITACPTVAFVVDSADSVQGCVPLTDINFFDSSAVDSPYVIVGRHWEFGDGQESTEQNPVVTFQTPGIYTVKLTITAMDTDNTEVSVTDSVVDFVKAYGDPVAGFTALTSTEGCFSPYQRFQVMFLDTSSGSIDSLIWHFGDGYIARNDTAPVHGYDAAGVYSCTLEAYGPCGVGTVAHDEYVTVWEMLEESSSGFTVEPTSGDTSTVFTFTDTSSGSVQTREWDFGDGQTTDSSDVVSHKYENAESYEVKLSVSNGCNSIEIIDSLTVSEQ